MSTQDPTNNGTQKKRTKWEPAALMALVMGLGLWIAFGPTSKPQLPTRPGAMTQEVRIAESRGVLEGAVDAGASEPTFRVLIAGHGSTPPSVSPVMTKKEAEQVFGVQVVGNVLSPRMNWVFRTFKITSWTSVVWVAIGFLGQLAFSGRMILQWITSEKHRKSVITESFWWFSLFGGLTLFSYFVWRQDPVAMLGQAFGVVIYARNIRLIRKHARRLAREGSTPG